MSFSSSVKDELSRQMPGARHCQIAETAAILSLCGRVKISASDHFWIDDLFFLLFNHDCYITYL